MTEAGTKYPGDTAAGIVVKSTLPLLVTAAIESMLLSILVFEEASAVYGAMGSICVVFIAQLIMTGYAARRACPEIKELQKKDAKEIGFLLKQIPSYVTSRVAATVILIGPTAFITVSSAMGLGPGRLIQSSGVIVLIVQLLLLFPFWGKAREGFQAWLMDSKVVHIESGYFRSFVVMLLSVVFIPAVMTAVVFFVAAELIIRDVTDRLTTDSYHQVALATLSGDTSKMSLDTLSDLTHFDRITPFAYRADISMQRGIDSADLHILEQVRDGRKTGTAINKETNTGLIWVPLRHPQIIGGLKVMLGGRSAISYYVQLFIIVVAVLASVLVATWYGTTIRRNFRIAIERFDSLPDGAVPDMPIVLPKELRMLFFELSQIKERFEMMRVTQQEAIRAGKKSREMKAWFFAGLSHDLKSPLNSVIGFTDLLIKGLEGELTPKQRFSILKIAEESEKLLIQIADILDTSKLDAGTFELDRSQVLAEDLLVECMSEVQRLIGTRPIKMNTEFQADLPSVYMDKARIRQALISLLARVMKVMKEGTVSLAAHVETRTDDGDAIFQMTIADPLGCVSLAEKEKMSNAFHSLDGTLSRSGAGGLGLGVALVKDVVQLHDGELHVIAREGSGPIFIMDLPLGGPISTN
jgi:signal transduction histidine kinase